MLEFWIFASHSICLKRMSNS